MNTAEKTMPEVSFTTSRFGSITVAEDRIISFVQGVPGFERLKRFILIDHDAEGVFRWLQAVDDPAVAFLLTDPNQFRPEYVVPLRKADADCLGVKDPSSLITLVMVCVSHETKELSLNLKGPVVFNAENMLAIQCVLDREDCPSHFPIKI
ncbi:MAG: flagellar assembly protein FliW [Deltaproteobacteria bacterium]|jgi:flagellar assembly factor FliW|nr:flagellar assembly protein FliW [Deltaproteobacteria bacterium]